MVSQIDRTCCWRRLVVLLCAAIVPAGNPARAGNYRFSVKADQILLNDQPIKIIGLRCSNALISDQTADQLIDNLDTFKSFGVNTVSVFFMGSRFGDVKGYRPDGSLDPVYTARMGRIIEAGDRRGMVVLVGCLYWSTSRAKEDLAHWKQDEANRAIANTVRWLKEHDYRNVFVDVDNEGMAHDATGWNIAAMIDAAHAVDPTLMIAYNDSDPPPPNADLLIHHSPKVAGKPWVQSEGTPNNAPGGYWGSYSKVQGLYNYINIGVYTEPMKRDQFRQTDNDIAKHAGHMLASTWLQCVAPHGPNQRPGGSGAKDDPGILWWLEHVKANYGPWTTLAARPMADNPSDRPWRTISLIKDGKVSDEWAHIGWGRFVVEGDALRTECDERGMGLLVYTKERLGNCQIRIVYKPEKPKANSGVVIRMDDGILKWPGKESVAVKREPNGKLSKEMIAKLQAAAEAEEGVWYAVHHGFEVQIMDDSDAAHRTGVIYGLSKAAALPKAKEDGWRTMVITLRGSLVLVDIDGQRVNSFDSARITAPATRRWTEPKLEIKRPEVGYIGLQNHDPGDVVFFKEVGVRPLVE